MTTKAKYTTNDRRAFLRNGLALAGSAALVLAARPGRVPFEARQTSGATPTPSMRGYRETPHILEYYRLAKF